jgi:hypothetical protein
MDTAPKGFSYSDKDGAEDGVIRAARIYCMRGE